MLRSSSTSALLAALVCLALAGAGACSDASSAALHDDGEDPAEPAPGSHGDTDDDADDTSPPTPPTEVDDAGTDAAPPVKADAGAGTAIPHAALLRAGLHPDASDRLRFAGITAAKITQTIGNFAASAGTHGEDGVADGKPYSAATDLSVKDLSDAQVKVLIDKLAALGFAPYFRKPGVDGWPASEARHVHVVYAGCKMKLSLRNQMRDFFVGKNALASHTPYTFHTWSPATVASVKALYLKSNPALN